MNEERSKEALKTAILEWRKNHGVQDNDPMLAAVELWEIYFTHAKLDGAIEKIPPFEEFRSTIEQLERLGDDFNSRAGEIIQELRAVPQIRNDLTSFPKFALVFTAMLALVAGMLIGRFLL